MHLLGRVGERHEGRPAWRLPLLETREALPHPEPARMASDCGVAFAERESPRDPFCFPGRLGQQPPRNPRARANDHQHRPQVPHVNFRESECKTANTRESTWILSYFQRRSSDCWRVGDRGDRHNAVKSGEKKCCQRPSQHVDSCAPRRQRPMGEGGIPEATPPHSISPIHLPPFAFVAGRLWAVRISVLRRSGTAILAV